jgi:hypothetical protein
MVIHYEHSHYMTKWRVGHARSLMRCTNPRIHNCQDDEKLAYHGPVRYKMEWIYTQAKVSGQISLELPCAIYSTACHDRTIWSLEAVLRCRARPCGWSIETGHYWSRVGLRRHRSLRLRQYWVRTILTTFYHMHHYYAATRDDIVNSSLKTSEEKWSEELQKLKENILKIEKQVRLDTGKVNEVYFNYAFMLGRYYYCNIRSEGVCMRVLYNRNSRNHALLTNNCGS